MSALCWYGASCFLAAQHPFEALQLQDRAGPIAHEGIWPWPSGRGGRGGGVEQQALSVVNGSEKAWAETGSQLPDLWLAMQQTVSHVTVRHISTFMATIQVYLGYKFREIWNKKSMWIYDRGGCCSGAARRKLCFNTLWTRMNGHPALLSLAFCPALQPNKYSGPTIQQRTKVFLHLHLNWAQHDHFKADINMSWPSRKTIVTGRLSSFKQTLCFYTLVLSSIVGIL